MHSYTSFESSLLCRKEKRQRVVQILLYGIVVMVSAILQVENVMLRCKDLPGEHFIRHIDGLALYRIVRPDCVIDEIPSFAQAIVFHQLLDEI